MNTVLANVAVNKRMAQLTEMLHYRHRLVVVGTRTHKVLSVGRECMQFSAAAALNDVSWF